MGNNGNNGNNINNKNGIHSAVSSMNGFVDIAYNLSYSPLPDIPVSDTNLIDEHDNMFKFVSNLMVIHQAPYIMNQEKEEEENQYAALNMVEWNRNNNKSDKKRKQILLPITSHKKMSVVNDKSEYVVNPRDDGLNHLKIC